jgi:hypothetical protein
MDDTAKTGLREVLIAERDRLFTAVNTLGNVQWLGTGGLLAACLGVLSFAAGIANMRVPVARFFGSFERMMGVAYPVGVFIVIGAAAFNLYIEFAIHQHLLRIDRAGRLLGILTGHSKLLVDDDLKLDKDWRKERIGLAVLLIVVTATIMGSLLWGTLSCWWHTYGWFQALLSYVASALLCLAAILYRFWVTGRMEAYSKKALAELEDGLKQSMGTQPAGPVG